MGILVDAVDPRGVEERGAALDPMDLVSFGEQECGQISAVLSGNSCDQCLLQGSVSFSFASASWPPAESHRTGLTLRGTLLHYSVCSIMLLDACTLSRNSAPIPPLTPDIRTYGIERDSRGSARIALGLAVFPDVVQHTRVPHGQD